MQAMPSLRSACASGNRVGSSDIPWELRSAAVSSRRAVHVNSFVRPIAFLVVMGAVWLSGSVARAQTPAPTPSAITAPAKSTATATQAIPLEDVPDRAEATRAEVDALVPKDAPLQTLERIGSELDRTLPEVESLLATTRATLADRPDIPVLNQSEAALPAHRHR